MVRTGQHPCRRRPQRDHHLRPAFLHFRNQQPLTAGDFLSGGVPVIWWSTPHHIGDPHLVPREAQVDPQETVKLSARLPREWHQGHVLIVTGSLTHDQNLTGDRPTPGDGGGALGDKTTPPATKNELAQGAVFRLDVGGAVVSGPGVSFSGHHITWGLGWVPASVCESSWR